MSTDPEFLDTETFYSYQSFASHFQKSTWSTFYLFAHDSSGWRRSCAHLVCLHHWRERMTQGSPKMSFSNWMLTQQDSLWLLPWALLSPVALMGCLLVCLTHQEVSCKRAVIALAERKYSTNIYWGKKRRRGGMKTGRGKSGKKGGREGAWEGMKPDIKSSVR